MLGPNILSAVSLAKADKTVLLRHWAWLVPSDPSVVCVTQLGDAFLAHPDGSIWFLDTGGGSVEKVAGDEVAWRRLLRDPDRLDQWSSRQLVQRLRKHGLRLKTGECYTYLTSPVLGGTYEPSNFKVVDVQTHFDIWGPLLGSIRKLPDGTRVEFVVKP